MLKERDAHLDEVFEITQPKKDGEIVVETIAPTVSPVAQPAQEVELKKSLEANVNNLDILYTKLDSVLEAHSEVAKEFSKGRDVEAVAKLAQTMVDLARESRETKQAMFQEKKGDPQPQVIGEQTNNVIQVGSMRELNDLIKLQRERSVNISNS